MPTMTGTTLLVRRLLPQPPRGSAEISVQLGSQTPTLFLPSMFFASSERHLNLQLQEKERAFQPGYISPQQNGKTPSLGSSLSALSAVTSFLLLIMSCLSPPYAARDKRRPAVQYEEERTKERMQENSLGFLD